MTEQEERDLRETISSLIDNGEKTGLEVYYELGCVALLAELDRLRDEVQRYKLQVQTVEKLSLAADEAWKAELDRLLVDNERLREAIDWAFTHLEGYRYDAARKTLKEILADTPAPGGEKGVNSGPQ